MPSIAHLGASVLGDPRLSTAATLWAIASSLWINSLVESPANKGEKLMRRDRRERQVRAGDEHDVADETPAFGDRVEQNLTPLAECEHAKDQQGGM